MCTSYDIIQNILDSFISNMHLSFLHAFACLDNSFFFDVNSITRTYIVYLYIHLLKGILVAIAEFSTCFLLCISGITCVSDKKK